MARLLLDHGANPYATMSARVESKSVKDTSLDSGNISKRATEEGRMSALAVLMRRNPNVASEVARK